MTAGPPAAPDNFHVEKIIGNSSLMLAWEPVPLDNTGTSNGVKVAGYKVSYFKTEHAPHPHPKQQN